MSGNIIVTTTANRVIWDVDNNSYSRALKRIKSLKEAHEKPSQRYASTAKKLQQSEGKAALAAAKAQTAKLRQAEQLTKQQQKQSAINARMATNEQRHAQKMASIAARNTAVSSLVPKNAQSLVEAIRAQREQADLEKRTQQIRAKGIRFSTATNGYNLTSRQRAQAIQDFAQLTKQYHAGSMALGEYNAK